MAMVKEKEQNTKDKKLLVGVIWNFSAELKLTFMALLVLCTLATLLPFIPSSFSLSTSDFRFCISRFSSAVPLNTTTTVEESSSSPSPEKNLDRVLDNGVIKRTFTGYGSAAYNFVSMSAYRGGVNSFAVIGLSSKPLHVYGHPSYRCEWVSLDPTQDPISTTGFKILTDWGYGRIYTTVVVNCTFSSISAVNPQNSGGTLILHATTGDPTLNLTDSISVLTEPPKSVDFDLYNSTKKTKKYDYLYCGSSLYGNLSPQRVREWIAYHVRFFGERSHFVLHDAGGIHEEVFEVLKPWIELGRVTLHDIRDQERFDGYYHNQFMIVNDCLHRYRFMTKWMFFFDVDEFLHVPVKETISSVMESLEEYSQFTIEQMPMSSRICYSGDGPARTYR